MSVLGFMYRKITQSNKLLRRKDLLDGALRPFLFLCLVRELEQGLLEVLVVAAAFYIVEKGLVQRKSGPRLQLIIHSV